jgi:hypothetical protein
MGRHKSTFKHPTAPARAEEPWASGRPLAQPEPSESTASTGKSTGARIGLRIKRRGRGESPTPPVRRGHSQQLLRASPGRGSSPHEPKRLQSKGVDPHDPLYQAHLSAQQAGRRGGTLLCSALLPL